MAGAGAGALDYLCGAIRAGACTGAALGGSAGESTFGGGAYATAGAGEGATTDGVATIIAG